MNNPLIYGYIKSLKFNQLTILYQLPSLCLVYLYLKQQPSKNYGYENKETFGARNAPSIAPKIVIVLLKMIDTTFGTRKYFARILTTPTA